MDARDPPTLLEELRARTQELFALLRSSQVLGEEASAAIEKTAGEIERRLARDQRTVLVVGRSPDRRALFDRILGEAVFARAQREGRATTVSLRRGDVIDYEAKLRGDVIERFRESVPEREDTFVKAVARADRDRTGAEEEVRAVAAQLEAEQRRATTIHIEDETLAQRTARLWAWLLTWIYGLFSAAPAPAPLPALPSRLEGRAREAEAKIAKATAHRATLEAERDSYATERQASFFGALRALGDDLSRGGEIDELALESPSSCLPPGVTLLIAPELRSFEAIDGCLFVTDGARPIRESEARPLDALGPTGCRSLPPTAKATDIRRALEDLRRAAPLVASEKAVVLARVCIEHAVQDGARAEAVCNERIAALEGQRLADPVEFRARSMARMEKAIDDGASDVVRAGLERLPPRIDAIKSEWRSAILACSDRKAVEICIQSIRDNAPVRIGALVDETNERIVSEMQRASDTMQLWLLEEIHARYQVARRVSAGEGAAPVIADAKSGEFVGIDGAPLLDAMDAFEQKRVSYGLGGAAAGAVIGTLIAPIIGTAIGAFLGVFAGLLKGIDSLTLDCAARIDACVDESRRQIEAQLEARRASLAVALRASLEEALDAAMQRFARSIARLMELETKTLATERAKLAKLADLRASLEAHETRFGVLAAHARATLHPRG